MDAFFEGFWHFAGSYWWLIFPLMGVLGGAGRAWQQALQRRHERKLETLRLKGELKAAELAARGGQPVNNRARRQQERIDRTAAVESDRELVARLMKEHDEITAKWLDYELDVAKLIAFPAMSDGRQPLTAAFLRAKKTADALRPASADGPFDDKQVAEYLDAVGNYAVAFDVAEKDARRLRDSTFSPAERERLKRAQHMLSVAVDGSATSAERQTAYKRVRKELDGLISLSDEAVVNLEKKVALQLEPGVQTTPAAPSAETASPSAHDADSQPEPDPLPASDPLRAPDPLRRREP
ncbi:hypothetical protein GCM10025768_00720 [Microbacterium pseudoresistens]|uniref:Uncharacterized protein n=1 Tax=Microbacterium pseudoresistens TaxID=640634 RepID=A0A7Y9ETY9_9MICO|nr:hypothetical protein [Microbacterium pseudoresistens]NYD53907.1 hypothetical protein [Microbacterium pseudoresistens]